METINKFYGIFSVLDQKLTWHLVIITTIVTATMDALLASNFTVKNQLYVIINLYYCPDTTNCTHGEIKLYGGQSNAEGDLQFCYNGVWVFLCRGWRWIPPNVVCRQLGYLDNNCKSIILRLCSIFINKGVSYSYYSLFGANNDVAPIMAVRFLCSGNENSLNYCSNYTSNSYCDRAIGFTCSSKN